MIAIFLKVHIIVIYIHALKNNKLCPTPFYFLIIEPFYTALLMWNWEHMTLRNERNFGRITTMCSLHTGLISLVLSGQIEWDNIPSPSYGSTVYWTFFQHQRVYGEVWKLKNTKPSHWSWLDQAKPVILTLAHGSHLRWSNWVRQYSISNCAKYKI